MKVRHQKVEIWGESLPPQPPRKKKKTEDQRLEKAFELLTACSNQTMNECQHFGNMKAGKLRNYNEMVWCVIQNEIMNVFLNVNMGLYECYHHTHLQPINPLQANFPSGPFKMYPQSINPPPHTSISSLRSPNTCPSRSGNTSPSPVSQSVSTITQFCSQFSHRKHLASYDMFRRKYWYTEVCTIIWPVFNESVPVKFVFN